MTEFLQGQREAVKYQFKEGRENKILYAAGGFLAGIVGGYGYGKTKNDD